MALNPLVLTTSAAEASPYWPKTPSANARRMNNRIVTLIRNSLFRGCQIHGFDDTCEGDACDFVHIAHQLRIRRFEHAHHVRLARYPGCTHIAYGLALFGETLACLDRSLLSCSELLKCHSRQISICNINVHFRFPFLVI